MELTLDARSSVALYFQTASRFWSSPNLIILSVENNIYFLAWYFIVSSQVSVPLAPLPNDSRIGQGPGPSVSKTITQTHLSKPDIGFKYSALDGRCQASLSTWICTAEYLDGVGCCLNDLTIIALPSEKLPLRRKSVQGRIKKKRRCCAA